MAMEYYQVAVRRLSENVVYFPANKPKLFDFDCEETANKTMACKFDAQSSQVKQTYHDFGIKKTKNKKAFFFFSLMF